jgi:hypothetical protein
MAYMEAEFDRLDINTGGELDVTELTQAEATVRSRWGYVNVRGLGVRVSSYRRSVNPHCFHSLSQAQMP